MLTLQDKFRLNVKRIVLRQNCIITQFQSQLHLCFLYVRLNFLVAQVQPKVVCRQGQLNLQNQHDLKYVPCQNHQIEEPDLELHHNHYYC